MHTSHDVVVTGIGLLTRLGLGKAPSQEGASANGDLAAFPSGKHLSDRRLLKSVSSTHAYGLVAFEDCVRDAKIEKTHYAPERIGLYVGAAPSLCADNDYFRDAILETKRPDGSFDEGKFGETFQGARPTTLLLGLPNNVFCYASIIIDARGPNSNYTAQDVSGQLSVLSAWRRVRRGKVDLAFAGGFGRGVDVPLQRILEMGSVQAAHESALASDGSAFVSLERRERAEKRGAKAIATIMGGFSAHDAQKFGGARSAEIFAQAIKRGLKDAGIVASDVGLIATSLRDVESLDTCESQALDQIFGDRKALPLLTAARQWGHLIEGGGIGEIQLAHDAFRVGMIDDHFIPNKLYRGQKQLESKLDSKRPTALLTRISPWGDYSGLIVRFA